MQWRGSTGKPSTTALSWSDEYQDIEPAQELLVQTIAAPHDNLFCVGDDDQCIYAWRRASVRRVVELDQTYPGLGATCPRYQLPRRSQDRSPLTKPHRAQQQPISEAIEPAGAPQ